VFSPCHDPNLKFKTILDKDSSILALVEAKNQDQVIGKLIFILQNHEELKTHKQCKIWVKLLPKIIHEINEHVKETHPNPRKPI
jgi:hypothetical protein